MKGQRNTFIMKGQDKTPEKLIEVETGNLPETELGNHDKNDHKAQRKDG